jgi:hypothetical protein
MKAFPDPNNTQAHGMDLRDWFAGQALVGLLAHGSRGDSSATATQAYEYADEMMKEREIKNDA